ncbi:unnamed protein product [Lymnaea stagnalis]|uniref:C2H2-type domain-containing protein n=1 Tax=Lymnaea stagnalis TaxID=6523 RepID=A0AAV2HC95_LYMST
MPELQHMDVAVANRFISSLSKSLQALCHGCMEFDSGIEIVGYINVNIDSGSKVDYVLNEKVLKSTTNSMTFVSNSFLAKKDQPKQTRDGACSPVSDTGSQNQYPSRFRGSFHGSTSFSQSYVLRGSQKRSVGMERDWRSPKKLRGARHQYPSAHESSSSSTAGLPFSPLPSVDGNFKSPLNQSTELTSDDGQINIKKEILDSDNKSEFPNDQDQLEQNQDLSSIKRDPDASMLGDNEPPSSDEPSDTTNKEFKGTFLRPSTSADHQLEEGSSDVNSPTAEKQSSSLSKSSEASASVKQRVSSTSPVDDSALSEDAPVENIASGSEVPEYDEAGEEGAYDQSGYSDPGEGSSDAGQFEVIEIDDEDEDVQAMFAESRAKYTTTQNNHPGSMRATSSRTLYPHSGDESSTYETFPCSDSLDLPNILQCPHCSETFLENSALKAHLSQYHGQNMPYTCSLCGKGYYSASGLYRHIRVHKGKMIMCPVCDSKFTQSSTLKRHLIRSHGLIPCIYCKLILRLGTEYNQHIHLCCKAVQKDVSSLDTSLSLS